MVGSVQNYILYTSKEGKEGVDMRHAVVLLRKITREPGCSKCMIFLLNSQGREGSE